MKSQICFFMMTSFLAVNLSFGQCDSISMIGEFSEWAGDLPMTQHVNNPDQFHAFVSFGEADDSYVDGLIELKFRQDASWEVNWGSSDFPSGTGLQNGPNIPVPYGDYSVVFNCVTGAYTFYPFCGVIGMMGEFNGWTEEMVMTKDEDSSQINRLSVIFSQEHDLFPDGYIEIKFRENNDWTRNWGGEGSPADTAIQDGPSILVPLGAYNIIFNCETMEYTFINTSGLPEIGISKDIMICPNPFHHSVSIEYELDKTCQVSLRIFGPMGSHVTTIADEWQVKGKHRVIWDATGFPEGVYFYWMIAGGKMTSGKMILHE